MLSHLSWRLMWTFLIERIFVCCLLFVVVVSVLIVVFVNFSNFVSLKNHWANFNQPWHKASLDERIQVCLNKGPQCFPKEESNKWKMHWQNFKNLLQNQYQHCKNILTTFKNLVHQNYKTKFQPNLAHIIHTWVRWMQIFTNERPFLLKRELLIFFNQCAA